MADLPLDPELPTNNEGHTEVPRRSLNPDPEVRTDKVMRSGESSASGRDGLEER
ncbi:hypothetical protein FPOAC2_07451 [Fusarium poae]